MNSRTRDQGATLVEFAVVMMLLVITTAIIIEIGVGLQEYGTASDVVASVTRQAATAPCSGLQEESFPRVYHDLRASFARSRLTSRLSSMIGPAALNGPDTNIEINSLDAADGLPAGLGRVLRVSVKVNFSCTFCSLFPHFAVSTITSEAMIEDQNVCVG